VRDLVAHQQRSSYPPHISAQIDWSTYQILQPVGTPAPGDDFAGGVVLDRQLPICELPCSEVASNTRLVDAPTLLFQLYRHVDPLAARSDRP